MPRKLPTGTGTHKERYLNNYSTPESCAYNIGYDLCDTWIMNMGISQAVLDVLDPLEAFGKALATASLTDMTDQEKLCFDVGFLDSWVDHGGKILPESPLGLQD